MTSLQLYHTNIQQEYYIRYRDFHYVHRDCSHKVRDCCLTVHFQDTTLSFCQINSILRHARTSKTVTCLLVEASVWIFVSPLSPLIYLHTGVSYLFSKSACLGSCNHFMSFGLCSAHCTCCFMMLIKSKSFLQYSGSTSCISQRPCPQTHHH